MEKRFVVFIVLTMLVLTGHVFIQSKFAPPRPPEADAGGQQPSELDEAGDLPAVPEGQVVADEQVAEDRQPTRDPGEAVAEVPPAPSAPDEAADAGGTTDARPAPHWYSLGSYDGSAGPLLVTATSRGGAIERVELVERQADGKLKYKNLQDTSGYLGRLALTTELGKGCRVNTVGAGTPAALAVAAESALPPGLQAGDLISRVSAVGREAVDTFLPADLELFLEETQPGDTIQLDVVRPGSGEIRFEVVLDERPLQVIRPEPLELDEQQQHPASCLITLTGIGGSRVAQQLTGNLSPRTANWQARSLEAADGLGPGIEFRFPLSTEQLASIGLEGGLELVKRFRLASGEDEDGARDYHLDMEIEIVNQDDEPQMVQYRLDGPNGLPLEGWWYSYKTHPDMFASAGARDVLLKRGGRRQLLTGCAAIYKAAAQQPDNPKIDLVNDAETINYMAVDTQYFVSAIIPAAGASDFSRASAVALGEHKPKRLQRTTNVSFELESTPAVVPPQSSVAQKFELYVGPKRPELLSKYGLEEAVYYGWFGAVARPLSAVLHFFYSLVGNYGIAIIMLTILVRGAMFPLSRKAAKNAAMMQELAPEMKAITEKYKNDMEKRAKAQQELFRKNNYNPLGGCWVMFLQLPIFIGLYRSLSVDVELRQAPLIPGWDWCSNLAGPDQLFYWGDIAFFGLFERTGMLGPYFNILPLGTVALFLVQQKMFTPPATDDQTKMQLQVMKFMTLFIGIMFFKVASGLCLYFIASSIWGIAERKLLPKKNLSPTETAPAPKKKSEPQRSASRNGPNGSPQKNAGKGKKRAKRR